MAGPAVTADAGRAAAAGARDLLRVLICGSVDDGKSTLIGRLLYDCRLLAEDQLAALGADSARRGGADAGPDLALVMDGLMAEREQGITIDVAYRTFATPRRKFIVADAPGHEQYTRNMATGASVSDLAVLLLDARKGVLVQTRRHAAIAHLLGIRAFVLAVNKMDLVGCAEARFAEIGGDFRAFAAGLGVTDVHAIPIVARDGDNVARPSGRMPWHRGPTLLAHLEAAEVAPPATGPHFRLPVQWVIRPADAARGYAGTIAAGAVGPGDSVVALPSRRVARVRAVMQDEAALPQARAGAAVALMLDAELDISRGDVLCAADHAPDVSDQFAADVIWMSEEPLLPGRQYLMKCASQTTPVTVTALRHRLGLEHLEEIAARQLALNEIGLCHLATLRPIVCEPYAASRALGGFILIDKASSATVGAGLIRFGLRRAQNLGWQALDIDKTARARLKAQRPFCLWLTGLSGSGKSTLANLLERRLHSEGRHTYVLDGDNVRHGLNRDLGFTDADRVENNRRVAEVARLMVDAGLIVIVAFISPFRSERQMARELFGDGEFLEVFVDTPLATCEARDAKGLYRKARAGELPHFTGVTSAYEPPEHPDIHLRGGEGTPEALLAEVMGTLREKL